MPGYIRMDRRDVDLVMAPNQHHHIIAGERMAASRAGVGLIIEELVGNIHQHPVVGFVPRFGATRS